MTNYILRVGGSSTLPLWNEPPGFVPILGRNFNSKYNTSSISPDGNTGSGYFPWKPGGSEGWDAIEGQRYRYSIIDDPTEPYSYTGSILLPRGKVMQVMYDDIPDNTGPGEMQTYSLPGVDPSEFYTFTTIKFDNSYKIGSVSNKIFFHRFNEAGQENKREEPFLAVFNSSTVSGSIMLAANFQGTPDNPLGFFTASTGTTGKALQKNQWYSLETYIKINSALDVADGIFRSWVDGELCIERTNVKYLLFSRDRLGTIHWSPTCGNCSTLSQPFYFYIGCQYVSRKRYENEPSDYIPLVGRSFTTLATGSGDRGTGTYPYKINGSEGWDDVEYGYSNIYLSNDGGAFVSPPEVITFRYPTQTVSSTGSFSPGISQTLYFNDTHGINGLTEVYVNFDLKYSSNWSGHTGSMNKILFYKGLDSEPYLATYGSGSNTLKFDVYDSENNFGNVAILSGSSSPVQIGIESGSITRNSWHRAEVQLILNSAPDVADGIINVWINGVKTHEYTNRVFISAGDTGTKIDYIQINPEWGGTGGTISNTQYLYIDNIYISGKG